MSWYAASRTLRWKLASDGIEIRVQVNACSNRPAVGVRSSAQPSGLQPIIECLQHCPTLFVTESSELSRACGRKVRNLRKPFDEPT
jgi:hypothetical protein